MPESLPDTFSCKFEITSYRHSSRMSESSVFVTLKRGNSEFWIKVWTSTKNFGCSSMNLRAPSNSRVMSWALIECISASKNWNMTLCPLKNMRSQIVSDTICFKLQPKRQMTH